jgi:predicted RNA binding protein YcfA (HicA-like mRNA interferase family)
MPRLGPIKRRDLIHYLRRLGFEGPFAGRKHQFMAKDDVTVRLPNPHRGDIGRELLVRILRQAHIEQEDWEQL